VLPTWGRVMPTTPPLRPRPSTRTRTPAPARNRTIPPLVDTPVEHQRVLRAQADILDTLVERQQVQQARVGRQRVYRARVDILDTLVERVQRAPVERQRVYRARVDTPADTRVARRPIRQVQDTRVRPDIRVCVPEPRAARGIQARPQVIQERRGMPVTRLPGFQARRGMQARSVIQVPREAMRLPSR
jgi:hypothetical protein